LAVAAAAAFLASAGVVLESGFGKGVRPTVASGVVESGWDGEAGAGAVEAGGVAGVWDGFWDGA